MEEMLEEDNKKGYTIVDNIWVVESVIERKRGLYTRWGGKNKENVAKSMLWGVVNVEDEETIYIDKRWEGSGWSKWLRGWCGTGNGIKTLDLDVTNGEASYKDPQLSQYMYTYYMYIYTYIHFLHLSIGLSQPFII